MRRYLTLGLTTLCLGATHLIGQTTECSLPAPVDSIPSAIAVEIGVADEAHDVPPHETNELLRQLANRITLPRVIAPRVFGDFATPPTLKVWGRDASSQPATPPPLPVIVTNWLRVDVRADGSLDNLVWLATSYDSAVDAALLAAVRGLDSTKAFTPFAQFVHLDGHRVMTMDIRLRTTVAGTRSAYISQNSTTHRSWLVENRPLPRYPVRGRPIKHDHPPLMLPPDARDAMHWPHVFGEVTIDETGHLVPGSLFPYVGHLKVVEAVRHQLPVFTYLPAYIGNCAVKFRDLVNLE